MREGGISAAGATGFWREHSLVWTPKKILEYALAAGGGRLSWAALYAELNAAGVKYSDWGGKNTGRDQRYSSTGVDCDH